MRSSRSMSHGSLQRSDAVMIPTMTTKLGESMAKSRCHNISNSSNTDTCVRYRWNYAKAKMYHTMVRSHKNTVVLSVIGCDPLTLDPES